jgi:hypothetical protein
MGVRINAFTDHDVKPFHDVNLSLFAASLGGSDSYTTQLLGFRRESYHHVGFRRECESSITRVTIVGLPSIRLGSVAHTMTPSSGR